MLVINNAPLYRFQKPVLKFTIKKSARNICINTIVDIIKRGCLLNIKLGSMNAALFPHCSFSIMAFAPCLLGGEMCNFSVKRIFLG